MVGRLSYWWQKIKQHWVAIGIGAIILVVFIALIIIGYQFDWTGFNGNNESDKTLWDWLNLLGVLAIPVVVGFGAIWFTTRQGKVADAENKDNQRETALQAYIDKISELLLHEHLSELKPEYEEVRNIARVRTLTLLRGLDAIRKASVLQFLYESKLIEKGNIIIDLDGANLRKTDLRRAKLQGAYLREADLSNTNLFKANLRETDLRGAILQGANLSGADLSDTNLLGAILQGADLSNANLSRAIMMAANLSRANLQNAGVTTEQLETVDSLQSATMPDGSIHP
jgi:hypothetical protein